MGGVRTRRARVRAVVLVVAVAASAVAVLGAGRDAGAATSTLAPVADASVNASTPTTRLGTSTQLIADASPTIQTFVRFDLRSITGPIQQARLRLHVANASQGGSPSGGTIATSSNTTWSETTVTWNTKPAIDGSAVTTLGAVTRNTWVEVDVTAAIAAGSLRTFTITSTNSDSVYYDSREARTNPPQLVLTTGVATTTTTSTTSTSTTTTSPTSSSTFTPVADTYVEDDTPTTNYGTATQITVDASPGRQTLLRFDLSSVTGTVSSARLRLHVANVSNAGSPQGGSVARVDDTAWTETGTTWNNRPTTWNADAATLGQVTQNTWAEIDVTPAVTTGALLTLGLHSSNTDGAYYDSRETGTGAPQLVLTFGAAPPPPPSGTVIAAVGDTACAPSGAVTTTSCRQVAASNLLVNDPSITWFLALGDLQYENGELANFQSAYEASYGRVKAKTKPAPGNHEYNTAGASGYYAYFGSAAGDPAKGYYSFDVGASWHVVALNSNCVSVVCSAGSVQEQWLRADLAASARPCTIAFFHHPRFSSGAHGNDTTFAPLWDALQQYGAELVLNGHEHDYERFAPQLPTGVAADNGIREIIVGTGGRSLGTFGTAVTNSVVRLSTFGVLKLTLGASTYGWQFVNESGTVLDSGTGTCH
jgi:hypothetical protein